MCRRVECATCHKPTYAGCGAHIEQVLAGVPQDDRCKCREAKQAASGASGASERSLFERLLGK